MSDTEPSWKRFVPGTWQRFQYRDAQKRSSAAVKEVMMVCDDAHLTVDSDPRCSALSRLREEGRGEGPFVTDCTEPDVKWTLADLSGSNDPDTGDIYSGLDRFERVKDNRWYDSGNSVDADRIKYGYDRAGNRIWRNNTVAASLSKAFDELYSYDGIHRLKDMQRGTLNGGRTAIANGTSTFGECWTLDSTGNWNNYRQDDDGNGCWDLDQTRTANAVNEITNLSESAGPAWVTPAYSRAGNMTTIPKPADPTTSFTATYDAWNRLVRLEEDNGSGSLWSVAEYAYDGSKRRVVVKSYTSGTLSETRHAYFTSNWQNIEERLGTSPSSADPDRQFVWGLRYIDDLILRDRDTDANGSLDERLYALQDANWNVTAIADPSTTIQERYAYAAYGVPLFLDSSFDPIGSSGLDWETLFCGYRWDDVSQTSCIRNRVYGASIGTWIQSDPLNFTDGTSLHQYCESAPINWVDPSGLLTDCPMNETRLVDMQPDGGATSTSVGIIIKTQKKWNDPKGYCGGFDWQIVWYLSSPSPPAGAFILQHVYVKRQVWDCDGHDVTLQRFRPGNKNGGKDLEFWEAFEIDPTRDRSVDGDAYRGKTMRCTRGYISVIGRYGLVRQSVSMFMPPLSTTAVPQAGGLPSSWDDPKIKTTPQRSHIIKVDWDCCC